MKKIIVFTEGRSELIFVRHALIQFIGYEHLSLKCFDLVSDRYREIPHKLENSNALIYFEIINVGMDERVLSVIGEYCKKYIDLGFDIIGLRDMYSERYKKRSHQIDPRVNDYFQNITNEYIQHLERPEKIHFFFAIMEFEAWLIGLYHIFERLDASLTPDSIRNQLGFDLENTDPENIFFHPAVTFAQILNIANIKYDKHGAEIESIISRINVDDIVRLVESNRCNSFALFFLKIQQVYEEAKS